MLYMYLLPSGRLEYVLLGLVSETQIALMLLFYNCKILNIGHIHYELTCTCMFENFHIKYV
jgi:hypothetical protein